MSLFPRVKCAGAFKGFPNASQLKVTTCSEMSRFVLIVRNEAALELKASGKGTGIGQVELVPDVELTELRAFIKMDRKKLWRLHFVFMSHRGSEFKKAGTCTVEAPSPGARTESSPGEGARVSPIIESCIRGPVETP